MTKEYLSKITGIDLDDIEKVEVGTLEKINDTKVSLPISVTLKRPINNMSIIVKIN